MNVRAIVAMVAIVAALALLGWLASLSLFTVSQSQEALIVRLGRPVGTVTEPGLRLKWPLVDSVIYYDKRLLPLEPGVDQIILGDQKRVEIESFSVFRIDDPLRFYQAVGTLDQARLQLGQIVGTTMRKQLGRGGVAVAADRRARPHHGAHPRRGRRCRRGDRRAGGRRADQARRPAGRNEPGDLRPHDLGAGARGQKGARMASRRQEIRSKADRERTIRCPKRSATASARAARAMPRRTAPPPRTAATRRSTTSIVPCSCTVRRSQGTPTLVLAPINSLTRYFDGGPFAAAPADKP